MESISNELTKAIEQHPNWPDDILHAMAIINEESGEATRAALHIYYENGRVEDLKQELIQTAAMCIRMLDNLDEFNRWKQ